MDDARDGVTMPLADSAAARAVAGLAATPRARAFVMRCRACNARLPSADAICAACNVAPVAVDATADRALRLQHRHAHKRARHILVDDRARERLVPTAIGLEHDEDAHAHAMQDDCNALAHTTVGHDHHEHRKANDRMVDSFFNIATKGRHRYLEDKRAGAKVTLVPASLIAAFFYSYAMAENEALLTMRPAGFYSDFVGRSSSWGAVKNLNGLVLLAAKRELIMLYTYVHKHVINVILPAGDSRKFSIEMRVCDFLWGREEPAPPGVPKAQVAGRPRTEPGTGH